MSHYVHPSNHVFAPRRQTSVVTLTAAVLFVLAVFAPAAAQPLRYSYTALYWFTGTPDGLYPEEGLVIDAQGNLYGTTDLGGDNCGAGGCGVIFKIDASGNESVLYNFTSATGYGQPSGSMVLDPQGSLYGVTQFGAANNSGTLFKVDPSGNETDLYTFASNGTGGSQFSSGLVRDANGNLYGTTDEGGSSGQGTVFKVDPAGNETVLYTFTGKADGGLPLAGLVLDPQGNLYGTTRYGGAYSDSGTVFKVDANGNESVLHSFGQAGDGVLPLAGLIRDSKGNLYGTTYGAGASCCGTVFEVTPTGTEALLYSFTGTSGDGAYPYASLVRDAKGNLYGTTYNGGAYGQGTIFKLNPAGHETVLYNYPGGLGGANPYTAMALDAKGSLYGTTSLGGVPTCDGTQGCGIVFKLTPQSLTKTTLTSSPNPSAYGEPVTFTAVVSSKSGLPPDGETVSFMKGKTVLGTGTLSGGSATFTTSTLKVGTTTVAAIYGGDTNLARSKSKPVKQQVINK